MNTSTPTPADAVREAVHGLSTLEVSPEEIAADAIRVAADALLPRPAIGDQSLLADRDRLLRLQFLQLANELAGNPAPAASREALAAAIKPTPEPIAWCRSDDFAASATKQQSFNGWRQHHFDCDVALYASPVPAPAAPETPAEALAARHLLEQVAAMADCIGAHTVGQITAISDRAAAWLRENSPGQPVIPPAIAYDAGNGVKIEAANRERTRWAVRSDSGGCLSRDLSWEPEPIPSDRPEDFLARCRWHSVEEAYAALMKSRASVAEEGKG